MTFFIFTVFALWRAAGSKALVRLNRVPDKVITRAFDRVWTVIFLMINVLVIFHALFLVHPFWTAGLMYVLMSVITLFVDQALFSDYRSNLVHLLNFSLKVVFFIARIKH